MLDLLLSPQWITALCLFLPFLGLVHKSNGEVIDTVSLLEGKQRVPLPKNRYQRLKLVIDGADNKTGETLTFGDLGRLRIERSGAEMKPLQAWTTWERWTQILDEFWDYQPQTSTSQGGTSTLTTYLFNSVPIIGELMDNAFHVTQNEEMKLILDFDSEPGGSTGLNSIINSGNLKVIAETNPLATESANVRWSYVNPPLSGGSVNEKEITGIEGENLLMIYISDPDDVVTEISMVRKFQGYEDERVWDDAPKERVQEWYESQARTFGDSSLYGLIVPAGGQLSQVRNQGVTLQLTTSGASNNVQIAYSRLVDPVPADSAAGVRSRNRQIVSA